MKSLFNIYKKWFSDWLIDNILAFNIVLFIYSLVIYLLGNNEIDFGYNLFLVGITLTYLIIKLIILKIFAILKNIKR